MRPLWAVKIEEEKEAEEPKEKVSLSLRWKSMSRLDMDASG
jgi:hypothetical protein